MKSPKRAQQQLHWVGPIEPIPNAASPDLAWQPIYPDTIPRVAMATHLQQSIAQPNVVIPNVADASWLPFYPDLIPRAPSRHAQLLQQSLQRFEPPFVIPDLEMRWKPIYPDRLDRPAPRLQSELVTPAPFERIVAPEGFLPVYPVRIDRRLFHASQQSAFHAPPPGSFLVVAASLAWLPVYPVSIPHPQFRPQGFVVDPILPAGGLCVLLDDVAVTSPTVADEVLTLSDLVGEAVTSPTIIEELC